MNRLGALLILLLVCSGSQTAVAQATDSWASVALNGDELTIRMPNSHEVKSREFSFEQFNVDGRVYTATEDGVDYIVWSLVDKGAAANSPPAYLYLDYCADLVWESLLKPRRDELPDEARLQSRMFYKRSLQAVNLPGREYSILMANRPGLTRFYFAGRQIYVLIVLDEDANSIAAQRFINSFGSKGSALPVATTVEAGPQLLPLGRGGGSGPVEGGNLGGNDRTLVGSASSTAAAATDYNRIFNGKEVTQRARILSKAEPQYTESARKYSVTGTVVLRAVFSRSGQVTHIKAVTSLPHGLTERAVDSARQIKFIPAVKDGHDVSMWFQLEYNFNLY